VNTFLANSILREPLEIRIQIPSRRLQQSNLAPSLQLPPEKRIIPEVSKSVNQAKAKIMGDRSPKSVNKKAGQKQNAASAAAKSKKQAIAAKQSAGKKK
jgi:hypothetical protein